MQEHSGLSARMWQTISAVLILTTLVIGYVVTVPPRSVLTWVVIVFLCVIELTLGIFLSLHAEAGAPGKTSHPMSSVLIGTVAFYAFVGLATIWLLYRYVKDLLPDFDRILISALALETVLFVVATVLLQRIDLSVQAKDALANQANRRAVDKGARISELIHLLRSIKPKDLDESQRVEYLIKGLESCEFQLQRSHQLLPPEMESVLSGIMTQIDVVAPLLLREGLNKTSFENVENILKDLQSSTRRLAVR
jgi:hypothetical protein